MGSRERGDLGRDDGGVPVLDAGVFLGGVLRAGVPAGESAGVPGGACRTSTSAIPLSSGDYRPWQRIGARTPRANSQPRRGSATRNLTSLTLPQRLKSSDATVVAAIGVKQQCVRRPRASWPSARQPTTPAIASTAAISRSTSATSRGCRATLCAGYGVADGLAWFWRCERLRACFRPLRR